jgi:large subunit ribosomal protein L25
MLAATSGCYTDPPMTPCAVLVGDSTHRGNLGAAPGASPRRPAGEPQPNQDRTVESLEPPEVKNPMAIARPTLAAEHREVTGKAVKHLRQAGRLPAVVYGHGEASDPLTLDTHEFEQLRRHTGPNTLVDLSVDGKGAKPVLVQTVQIHPVNRRPLHVDLFLVRMTEELTVDVPLVAIGSALAVTELNGTLLHPTETVRVKALPDHLPQSIEYQIDSLIDFDATIHVRDLAIPGDVTLLTDADEIIAKVQAPRIEVEEVPVAAEGEELEGEAAAAEGEGAEGSAAEDGSGGEQAEEG